MRFTITCPNCGERDLYEFHFGGHDRGPPPQQKDLRAEDYLRYSQFRTTRTGPQLEWWYHSSGCGGWFTTWRNPATNCEEKPNGAVDD